MLDLDDESLKCVTRILAEHVPECEVRAFGSRVTGTAKPYSDLDLAVMGDERLDVSRMNRLQEAFEYSDLPMRVDVVDWQSCSEKFRKIIEENCAVIQ